MRQQAANRDLVVDGGRRSRTFGLLIQESGGQFSRFLAHRALERLDRLAAVVG